MSAASKRAVAIGCGLALAALVVFELLGDDREARDAPRAFTSARDDDPRATLPTPRAATTPHAEPTPLAPAEPDVVEEPAPRLDGDPFALRVRDDAGRPVPDLPLRVDVRAQPGVPEYVARFVSTDAHGVAEFGPLPADVELLWSCSDPAWFFARWDGDGAPELHAGTLRTDAGPVVDLLGVRRGASLRGVFLDVEGGPLSNVHAHLFTRATPDDTEPRRAWRQVGEMSMTGGWFVFTLLTAGEYRVVAVERESERAVRVHHVAVQLARDEQRDVGIVPRDPLAPVQLLRLQPTLDGRPAAPAEVSAKPDELRFTVHLDDDGDAPPVHLGDLPGDGLDVEVRGLPHARWRPELGPRLLVDRTRLHAALPPAVPSYAPRVLPGAPLTLELPFTRPVELAVHLRDETFGPPPRDLQLSLLDDSGRTRLAIDAKMPPPGIPITLSAVPGAATLIVRDQRARGPHPTERFGVLAVHGLEVHAPGPQRVDVTLHAPPEVRGSLVWADGAPTERLVLRIRLPGGRAPIDDGRMLAYMATDLSGAFSSRGLPPDTELELVVGNGRGEHVHAFRTAGPGATQQLAPITLPTEAP